MTNINNNKSFFRRTEVLVALFGVIAPFFITYLINAFDKDQKEITITYSQLDPIITETNEIVNNLVINYDSTNVKNISKISFKVKNSGTLCLTKNDFIDGPININLRYLNGEKSLILQAVEKENANQQNSVLKFKNLQHSSMIIYNPSLLNPKDEVLIEAYLLNTPNTKITSRGKILNGNIIGPNSIEVKENKIGYKSFILSWNSFFGNKWFSICIDILLFFFLAIATLIHLAESTEGKNRDVKYLLIIIGITTGAISIFLIAIIVSTLLYV